MIFNLAVKWINDHDVELYCFMAGMFFACIIFLISSAHHSSKEKQTQLSHLRNQAIFHEPRLEEARIQLLGAEIELRRHERVWRRSQIEDIIRKAESHLKKAKKELSRAYPH